MLRPLLWIIALSQLVLAGFTLLLPLTFFGLMGLTVPPADTGYLIGMLGARFLAYGIGMVMLARSQHPSRFWVGNMLLIQCVDLGLAAIYVAAGTVPLSAAAFPAFNAALFSAGLVIALIRWPSEPAA